MANGCTCRITSSLRTVDVVFVAVAIFVMDMSVSYSLSSYFHLHSRRVVIMRFYLEPCMGRVGKKLRIE